jgi:ArsR family transcriptional regulator, arsenate/arsenite/antimonite-responsive transcriptional repressor
MENLIEIFKTLSDETRLRILKLLEHGELCVCGIVAALDMIQPKVSFHLGVLKEAKFITDRRQGKWIYYRIDDSDLFRRFLILSILEKIAEDTISEDIKRLQDFSENKKTQETNRTITERRTEC